MEHFIGELFISVFPQEFPKLENDAQCKLNITEMLKTHETSHASSGVNVSSYLTAKDCKLYCASNSSCCGCIKVCDVTCKWYSLTDCERWRNSNSDIEQCLAEKPGISIL